MSAENCLRAEFHCVVSSKQIESQVFSSGSSIKKTNLGTGFVEGQET